MASRQQLFQRPIMFWIGIAAVTTGVILHLPMYLHSADMGYQMVGMHMDPAMTAGMILIPIGMACTIVGIWPRRPPDPAPGGPQSYRVTALDSAPLNRAHVALLLVMAAAVTIDVMKPTTLAFVMPGMAQEYDLKSPLNPDGQIPVAWLPLVALTGMVLGALVWGSLGDRIGRRASILLAGVMFIGTSICGAMPSFAGNLLMCFLMGAAVGGMLPIAFALLAEAIPARHRGWLMVLIGGDVAGAYILTSFLASVLEPRFSWRILWLIGLPTGVLLILLNRWIPESPRFLLATGRIDQARAVMARFGAKLVPDPTPTPANAPEQTTTRLRQLWRPPYRGLTGALALFALAWGLVNNGFLLWLPTNLRQLGLPVASADQLLAASALIGFPAVFLVAWLYGFWSSKATMIIAATAVAAALTTFAVLGSSIAHNGLLLQAMIVLLLAGTGAMLAMLTPYSSEVFPTQIRARGTGLAGACARAGGFLGVGAVLLTITPASLTGAALLGAIPTILAIAALWFYGVETRRRSLEEINADRQVKVASVSITPSRSSPAP